MSREQYILEAAASNLEDLADNLKCDAPKEVKVLFVGISGGLALATVLQHLGFVKWARIVIGSFFLRYKYPNLVSFEKE